MEHGVVAPIFQKKKRSENLVGKKLDKALNSSKQFGEQITFVVLFTVKKISIILEVLFTLNCPRQFYSYPQNFFFTVVFLCSNCYTSMSVRQDCYQKTSKIFDFSPNCSKKIKDWFYQVHIQSGVSGYFPCTRSIPSCVF